MHKRFIIIFLTLLPLFPRAQTINGIVTDEDRQPLPNATIQLEGSNYFELTDAFGKFSLNTRGISNRIIVSYIGYEADTLEITKGKFMQIALRSNVELEEIIVKGDKTFIDPLNPITNEVILESELLKAACCNLSESFETNATVDVTYADAVTGTRQIKMLGLDGKYVYLLREDVPMIRGLIATNGLTFIPGTWLQSIDVGKGIGTVASGYESMTGQINLDFKNPASKEKLYLNAYVNGVGRTELNANYSGRISEKVSTAILGHVNVRPAEVDRNNDGFMDIPKGRQFNVFNRYQISGKRIESQIGFQAMLDEKVGGQLGFTRNEDPSVSSLYGISLVAKRFELYGKTGLLFPNKPYRGLGVIYSGSYVSREEGYGRNAYNGEQKTFYGNLLYQSIIGNSFHQYRTGLSFLLDDYDENLNDSTFTRNERVPGAFFEYSFSGPHKWSFIAGIRSDYHNLYGWLFNPRLHFQYGFSEESSFRLAVGKGNRVPNPVAENANLLASSRAFIVQEQIEPEESWNAGGSITHQLQVARRPMTLTADYFYTSFNNQLVVDRENSAREVRLYNLQGKSVANSFQFEVKYELIKSLTAKAAYKYYDVNIDYQTVGNLRTPFIPKDRFFVNLEYATYYDKWVFDWTGQWYGQQRVPSTAENPEVFRVSETSPAYFVMNAQVRRTFRWGSVYLGGENLANFRQENPIIDPQDPFGNYFDATLVWGPVLGRMVYAGVRYKIKNNN